MLKFTPLEFETNNDTGNPAIVKLVKIYSVGVWNKLAQKAQSAQEQLKFTPLEFETRRKTALSAVNEVKIYSVGVWNDISFTALTRCIKVKIYSVGVWNLKYGHEYCMTQVLKFTPLEFETIIGLACKLSEINS